MRPLLQRPKFSLKPWDRPLSLGEQVVFFGVHSVQTAMMWHLVHTQQYSTWLLVPLAALNTIATYHHLTRSLRGFGIPVTPTI